MAAMDDRAKCPEGLESGAWSRAGAWADDGCVYFIAAPEVRRVKIGFTTDHPGSRLAALSTASPVALAPLGIVLGDIEKEAKLHARFAELRVRGEWFSHKGRLRAFVRGSLMPWPGPLPTPEEVAARVGGHYSARVGIVDAAILCGLNVIQMRSEIGRGRIVFERDRKSDPLTTTLGSAMGLKAEVEQREKRRKIARPGPIAAEEDWRAILEAARS